MMKPTHINQFICCVLKQKHFVKGNLLYNVDFKKLIQVVNSYCRFMHHCALDGTYTNPSVSVLDTIPSGWAPTTQDHVDSFDGFYAFDMTKSQPGFKSGFKSAESFKTVSLKSLSLCWYQMFLQHQFVFDTVRIYFNYFPGSFIIT